MRLLRQVVVQWIAARVQRRQTREARRRQLAILHIERIVSLGRRLSRVSLEVGSAGQCTSTGGYITVVSLLLLHEIDDVHGFSLERFLHAL